MVYKAYVRETLQREIEVEANSEEEAVQKIESMYYEGEVILDYSDLIDTKFCNCEMTKNEILIMNEISNFCENECSSKECCHEGECCDECDWSVVLEARLKLLERN